MRVTRRWQRIEHPNGPSSREAAFEVVRSDGNAGLWVYAIGHSASWLLSLPGIMLQARAQIPFRASPGHGSVTFALRDLVNIRFEFGNRGHGRG